MLPGNTGKTVGRQIILGPGIKSDAFWVTKQASWKVRNSHLPHTLSSWRSLKEAGGEVMIEQKLMQEGNMILCPGRNQ